MTSLENRPNQALVVIDVQNDVVANAHNRDAVVANIVALVERARVAGTPVVWVQHGEAHIPVGSPGWQLVSELEPNPDEAVIRKSWGDSFEATELESVLARLEVGHLFVAGAQTDACIRETLHGALVRGYDATLVGDAHTTDDPGQYGLPLDAAAVIAHTNLVWKYTTAPGRVGDTVDTADVAFGYAAPAEDQ